MSPHQALAKKLGLDVVSYAKINSFRHTQRFTSGWGRNILFILNLNTMQGDKRTHKLRCDRQSAYPLHQGARSLEDALHYAFLTMKRLIIGLYNLGITCVT